MAIFLHCLLLLLITGTGGRSWQPQSQLRSAVLRDFVNSKNVPTTIPGSSASSTSPVLSDDVSRGGHASVKSLEDTVDKITSKNKQSTSESIKTMNMNVEIKSRKKRKQVSGSKKIALKLKVRELICKCKYEFLSFFLILDFDI